MSGEPGRGPLFATLHDVLLCPGTVTRAVLDHADAPYVSLGRLLALLIAVFFALTLIQQRRPAPLSPEVASACADSLSTTDIGMLLQVAREQNASPQSAQALSILTDVLCNSGRYTRAFSLAVPIGFIVLMPLSALLMMGAFRKQMPGFRANWVYNLEAHAALFALLSALALIGFVGSMIIGTLASIAGLFYASWNVVDGVQRAYRVSGRTAMWRTTAVGVPYALALALVSLFVMAMFVAH